MAVNGNIFESSRVDQIARDVLALVAAIYIPSVGVMLYGEMGRIRPGDHRDRRVVIGRPEIAPRG